MKATQQLHDPGQGLWFDNIREGTQTSAKSWCDLMEYIVLKSAMLTQTRPVRTTP
ncbi:MAG: hypothetical protein ACK2UI_02120 [Anaerolineae bacterium]|jgi:hypothetical protein